MERALGGRGTVPGHRQPLTRGGREGGGTQSALSGPQVGCGSVTHFPCEEIIKL